MKKDKVAICHWFLLFIVFLLPFQLTACNKNNTFVINEEDKMKGEISVYYVDYADQFSGNSNYTFETALLLQDLQNEYPDLEIKPTTFGSREAFMTQVATELNAGKGPDLFLLNYATQLNWSKMAKSGVYENLTPYIENDKGYKADAYFEQVMHAGQIDGKQYIIPLSFNVMSLFTSEEKLKENKVNLKIGYDYKDVFSMINDSIEKALKDDQVIPLALFLDRKDLLTCLMESFGMPFINYEDSVPAIDKESLLETCNFIRNLYPYVAEAYNNRVDYSSKTENARKIEFSISNWSYVSETIRLKTMMNKIDQELVSLILPKYDDEKETSAQIYHYTAVNGNSPNKQLAYDVARHLLEIASGENIRNNFPVKKDKFDAWMQDIAEVGQGNMMLDGVSINTENISDDVTKISEMVKNIKFVSLNNIDVMMIINDTMMAYIGGTRTFDECYEETVNKLNLYINE